ncbi:MAG: phosphoenolpyruvate--protein phosphotransferase [Myxococcales bacterium]|nr:phosphoenolpyruvate--protein phosphotransferase [Myxococcales bacterium]
MNDTHPHRTRQLLHGLGVAPGYAIGRAHLVERRQLRVPRYHIAPEDIDAELIRFDAALDESEAQIKALKTRLQEAGEEHYLILDAHQLMLRDEMLVDGVRQTVRAQFINAEWALKKVLRGIKQVFDNIDDEYFRERRSDVDFVGDRLMRTLLGRAQPNLDEAGHSAIIVAYDLSPADTVTLTRSPVLGFVTEAGGRTSHTAIIARSFELPAVVAVEGLVDTVGSGDRLIIDGTSGLIIVEPTPDEIARYQALQQSYSAQRARLDEVRHHAATTADGVRITIRGNIERPAETRIVLDHGAEGVGLYRTEYLYMNRDALPDEEEQYAHYRQVLEECGPAGATIRTLDIGGDKMIEPMRINGEANPVMGLRAIRFCFREPEMFRTQLRALLRASAHGNLRLMVPLISGVDDVRRVAELIAECRAALDAEGHAMAERVPFGVMIELPAAVMLADWIAEEVDFFSIGTNDLVQYSLAVDRANRHVAHLYNPLHPAIIRQLRHVVAAAMAAGIELSLCGEMAGEALAAPVLIGLGLRTLSMNATSVPLIKAMVRDLRVSECEKLCAEIATLRTAAEVDARVRAAAREMFDGTLAASILDPMLRESGE